MPFLTLERSFRAAEEPNHGQHAHEIRLDAGNAQYTSEFFVRQILESLAAVAEAEHLPKIRSSPAVSIIVDESADIANVKELCVYAR